MILVKFYGFLALSIVLGLICTALYVRFCSIVANWINKRYGDRLRRLFRNGFADVSDQRGKTREQGSIKVRYIYGFKKLHKWNYIKLGIFWFIQNIIGKANIGKNCHYKNRECSSKDGDRNIKCFLHSHFHIGKSIKRETKGVNQNKANGNK